MKSEQEIRDLMLVCLLAARNGIDPEANHRLSALCAWIVGDVPLPEVDRLVELGRRMREEVERHVQN